MRNEYKEKIASKIAARYADLEVRIIQDIVRRIKKTGEITSTADWQINRLKILGYSSEDIENALKDTLNASYPEMFELYDKVIDWEYVRNKDIYEQINAEYIPFEENEHLIQVTSAIKKQRLEDLENITRSLGFYLDYGGRKVLTPLSQVYSGYLDNACMDIVTGAFDYNTVLRRVVTQLTNSGLRQIEYSSGYANRIEVAARRAVMTGLTQLSGKIAEYNAEKLGTEYFEVEWHAGARPTHTVWQGRVWSQQQLYDVCGLGTVTGLCGANCYHTYFPFVPGVSVRTYTDEWLDEQNRKESEPTEFRGKEYTLYEAKQRQRQMETAMRAQREKVQLLQKGGADPQEVILQKAKYQGQLNEYAVFSRKMGLKEERERIYLDMQEYVATNTKRQNALFPAEMVKNASKDVAQYKRYKEVLGDSVGSLAKFGQVKYNDSESWEYLNGLKEYLEKYPISSKKYYDAGKRLEKLGIKKGLLLPKVEKQAFILPEGKHDPYHIMKRMLERNITDDDVRSYMRNAKAMFVQWGGKRQLFVSDGGMVLITKQGEEWIYKTVWSKYDYDEESVKIMEVLKDAGL
ncbi:phage minor capsid protein [[Ruminococcus] lactaris]|uniref:phage minor capsid protein n=1 Tax=[Ruminococcus] lactaris TaxID=46228 RepID=UPI002430A260|nr:phage minor capsid protein [[Ruminococcus] lactaris]